MINEQINQVVKQLKAANNILVVLGNSDNLDNLAASLSLNQFLRKFDKKVEIVSLNTTPEKFNFLPENSSVKLADNLVKNLAIEVNLTEKEISELRYQKLKEKLLIYLSAKKGEFSANDVAIKGSVYPYDLVVNIGIANLEELGEFYSKHTQLFFETPVINIDFKSSNLNYGQINLVKLTASANSEIIFDLVSEYDENFIDEPIATMLLAGLVSQTNSFQSVKTSPQVFAKASKLITLGAKQQDIVTQLYKTKSLGFLRLWGRVLARIKFDPKTELIHSLISLSDIEKSEATKVDVKEIIFEMKQQLSFAKYFLVFIEASASKTQGFAISLGALNFFDLLAPYGAKSVSEAVDFIVPKNLTESEEEVISKIREEISKFVS